MKKNKIKARKTDSKKSESETHAHYCCHCNRYWKHTQFLKTCLGQGTMMGPWFLAQNCLPCVKDLRRRAHAIILFERVAMNTKESLSGARR